METDESLDARIATIRAFIRDEVIPLERALLGHSLLLRLRPVQGRRDLPADLFRYRRGFTRDQRFGKLDVLVVACARSAVRAIERHRVDDLA